MQILPEGVRDDMARFNRANMDATCDVLPASEHSGGFDDDAPAPGDPIAEGVRCRVATAASLGMNERVQQGQTVTIAPFVVFLDGIVPVTGAASLVVTYDADSVHAGRTVTFNVVSVEDPISFQIQTVCQCNEAR